jgi:ABC-type bacteriocin/lantibiotic exporter with double-glycine peptidase domain
MISFQRLLPFVQSLYNFFIQYKIGLPPLLSLLKETNQLKLSEKAIQFVVGEIILEDLTFKIPNSNKKLVIKRLVIKKSKPLIIVGESGCGKSCFLDVLLGFTLIESGKIYIDGKLVTNDFFIRNRANVSYVKQESTVLLSNPLLSMMLENCNKYVLEKISRKLNIYNLFTNDKQSKYGSTLRKYSGGERQRLSILRALLHDKQFLIGDEITSALDTENKEVLFNIVNESSHNKFCVFVSHEDMNLKNSSTFNFSSPSVLYI